MAREYTIHAARAKLSVAMDANESIAAMFLLSTTNMFKVLPLVNPRVGKKRDELSSSMLTETADQSVTWLDLKKKKSSNNFVEDHFKLVI